MSKTGINTNPFNLKDQPLLNVIFDKIGKIKSIDKIFLNSNSTDLTELVNNINPKIIFVSTLCIIYNNEAATIVPRFEMINNIRRTRVIQVSSTQTDIFDKIFYFNRIFNYAPIVINTEISIIGFRIEIE